jgi:hypothetical protein
MTFFTPSYVLKKNIEPGAEPMAPAPRPAYTPLAETEGERQSEAVRDRVYTPLKPPDLMKPSADCSRVLIVSSGYSAMSTEGPATAPDSSEHTKEGWRPVALMAAALSLYVRVSLAGVLHARALCLSVSLSLSSSPAETTSTRVPVRLSPASPHQAYTHTISPSLSVSLSLSLCVCVCVCVCGRVHTVSNHGRDSEGENGCARCTGGRRSVESVVRAADLVICLMFRPGRLPVWSLRVTEAD